MLRGGGYGVLPLPPKGSHAAGDLLPNYALVPWTYTDLALPVWQPHRDFLGIDTRRAKTAQKTRHHELSRLVGLLARWRDVRESGADRRGRDLSRSRLLLGNVHKRRDDRI